MTGRAWLGVGAVAWGALFCALLWLLLAPTPKFIPPGAPRLEAEKIQVLTCTTQVATVDPNGVTHIETIDCKEEKQ